MTFSSPGDPASTSALGGALLSQAGRLADLVLDLDASASRASRAGARRGRADAGPPGTTDTAGGDRTARVGSPGPTRREEELLTRAATELDRVGSLLQAWTTTAVESAARLRALEPALARVDLVVDGHLVVERSGPSRVQPAQRLAERERLQELLNRVTAARSRELARLGRELEQSGTTLAALSVRARSGT
ncbi:hypothetical protein GCM10009740_26920 [Terrabacter terrae]|uniref:Uncharacterized protein n=1 Tax=Terrabacter terrae TaxID=318434 RepID=A0ABN2UEA2_9MICO